jgi:hypothetical protein
MGPIGCPETSVRNYHYSLRNKPEECSSLPQISFKYVSQLILQLMLECAFHLIMWPTLFFQIDIKDENRTVWLKNRATLILPMYSYWLYVNKHCHNGNKHVLTWVGFTYTVRSKGSGTEFFTAFLPTPSTGPRLNYVVKTVSHTSANWL